MTFHSRLVLSLLAAILPPVQAAHAADTAQICAAAAAIPIPAADQAGTAPETCSAYRAYYGIGQPADFELARACAFRERQAKEDPGWAFRGPAILTMLYANGRGVPRDMDLAVKFACEISGAAIAETEYRVEHLRHLDTAKTFDLCDDITSGYMGGQCSGKQSDLAEQERKRKTASLLRDADAAQQAAFDALLKAGEAYFDQNAVVTVGRSGTGRAGFIIDETERQRTLFTDTLTRLERHEIPDEMKSDFAGADHDLNEIYPKLLAWADPEDDRPVADIRKAERAWLRYRDRWVDFARSRYPAIPSERIKTLITRQRVATIDHILHPGH